MEHAAEAIARATVRTTVLTLIAWGIAAIAGIHVHFWPLVGISVLAGMFIRVAAYVGNED